ncbi:hypothetical protein AKG34_08655 [Peribacillus butanolivorans]|nr:hypothetical protein AKG34_08655 [Peribacillus butanolivorans]
MNISIEVHLHTRGTNFLKRGTFPVLASNFKKDSEWTVAIAAYEWIQKINKEIGSSGDFRINKVVYNGENDISDLVRKVGPIIQDDLPF